MILLAFITGSLGCVGLMILVFIDPPHDHWLWKPVGWPQRVATAAFDLIYVVGGLLSLGLMGSTIVLALIALVLL